MDIPQIDNVSAGCIVAYDARTGDVLWTHEKIVEVIRGGVDRPARVTEADREQVRAEAARIFRGREVDALIAPEDFVVREDLRISVDTASRALVTAPATQETLAHRFGTAAR